MPFVILVATDFSDASDRAVSQALRLARRAHARLVIAHVVPPSLLPETERDRVHEDEARMLLDRLRGEAENNGIAVTVELRHGAVVAQLLSLVDSLPADLVVIGARGRGWITRALWGSISQRMYRESGVPVLLVPNPASSEDHAEDAL